MQLYACKMMESVRFIADSEVPRIGALAREGGRRLWSFTAVIIEQVAIFDESPVFVRPPVIHSRCDGADPGRSIPRSRGCKLLIDGFHDTRDAHAAFHAVIEPKVKARRVFEDDTFADARLKVAVPVIEHLDDMFRTVLRSDDADIDIGVLQVRGNVHVIHGDENVRERMLARDNRPQLTLKEFADSDKSVFHGKFSVFSIEWGSFSVSVLKTEHCQRKTPSGGTG